MRDLVCELMGGEEKCTLTPFFGVYKPSKRICIRNINTADSGGVLA